MKKAIALSLVLFLVGCSSLPGLPGYISSSHSNFDGSTALSMEPAMVYRDNDGLSGSDLQLSLYWSTAFEPGTVLMEAEVGGYKSFSRSAPLVFSVDGELVSPEPASATTDYSFDSSAFRHGYPSTSSSQAFLVDEEFVLLLLDAERVAVRARTLEGYAEGVFTDDTANSAYLAFKEFMDRREEIIARQ